MFLEKNIEASIRIIIRDGIPNISLNTMAIMEKVMPITIKIITKGRAKAPIIRVIMPMTTPTRIIANSVNIFTPPFLCYILVLLNI